jgi:two-component system, OmpR family, response regulator RegX3
MHIAVLEDNPDDAQHTCEVIARLGHTVSSYARSSQFYNALKQTQFDACVFDWELQETSGVEVLRHVRDFLKLSLPIVFLTARNAEKDVVDVLQAGADDFCTKPIRAAEFGARLQALLRRAYPPTNTHEVQSLHGYSFNPDSFVVQWPSGDTKLAEKEFKLALYFFMHADQPLSRERLMQEVWGQNAEGLNSRTLDVHVSRVRQQLRIGADSGQVSLRSVHGFGYRLSVPFEKEEAV